MVSRKDETGKLEAQKMKTGSKLSLFLSPEPSLTHDVQFEPGKEGVGGSTGRASQDEKVWKLFQSIMN